jgi:hypothetical protein
MNDDAIERVVRGAFDLTDDSLSVEKMGNGSFVVQRKTAGGKILPEIVGRVRDNNSISFSEPVSDLTPIQLSSFESIKSHILSRLLSGDELPSHSSRNAGRFFLFSDGGFPDIYSPFLQDHTLENCVMDGQVRVHHALFDLMTLLGYTLILQTSVDDGDTPTTSCIAVPTSSIYPTRSNF